MKRNQSVSAEARARVEAFMGEAGAVGLSDERREWRFDGAEHHITVAGYGSRQMQLVVEYRSLSDDLVRRMLVASLWPGPLGVIYSWSEWRRDRAAELAHHCGEVRAAAVVADLFTAAKRADPEGVAREVARYYAVLEEARRDAEVAKTAWKYMLT